jgi:DNA-directed RNA polymerase specialized sigma24 family protein
MMNWRDSERAVKAFSHRVMRRLVAAGASADLAQDVRQELWVAWCIARDSYREDSPATFMTYLHNGMRMHINTWARSNVNKRHQEVIAYSLDHSGGPDDEEGESLQARIASADPTPDVAVFEEDRWQKSIALLSPRTRKFIELLREPPACLLAEVRALEAKSSYAKSKGVSMPFANRVTTTLIFDAMGAPRSERLRIARELREVSEYMQTLENDI